MNTYKIKHVILVIMSLIILSSCYNTPADSITTEKEETKATDELTRKPTDYQQGNKNTEKEEEMVFCTQEFDPVCGKVNVQCITAPCDPVKQTFPNKCHAIKGKAFDIQPGTCEK